MTSYAKKTQLYEFLDILLAQYMKKIVKKNETQIANVSVNETILLNMIIFAIRCKKKIEKKNRVSNCMKLVRRDFNERDIYFRRICNKSTNHI